MKHNMIKMVVLAAAMGIGGSALAADDTTRCGSAQTKALGKVFDGAIKEGARACGRADSEAEADVLDEINTDKLTGVAERFNKAITKSVDKYDQANCFVDDSGGEAIDPADVINLAEGFAVAICTSSP